MCISHMPRDGTLPLVSAWPAEQWGELVNAAWGRQFQKPPGCEILQMAVNRGDLQSGEYSNNTGAAMLLSKGPPSAAEPQADISHADGEEACKHSP